MAWAKFDDQYPDHPKIVEVGPLGMALHTAATCYCARYLTNGFVSSAMISRLINLDGICVVRNGVTNTVTINDVTALLTKAGLFEIVSGGFYVHDYLKYNPPAEIVKAEREENSARQKEWRGRNRDKKGKFARNGVSHAANNGDVTSAPSPYPLIKESVVEASEQNFLPPNLKATEEEKIFLQFLCSSFDTKLANTWQARTILNLRNMYGESQTTEAFQWYADSGLSFDETVKRAKGALPTWGQVQKPYKSNGGKFAQPIKKKIPDPEGVEGVGNPQTWPSTKRNAAAERKAREVTHGT